MSLCSDDAALVGPISLFIGVESANWQLQDFTNAALFAKEHGVTTLFVKAFEVGSSAGDANGYWYGGFSGFDNIYSALQPLVNVIPYGFLYGDTYGKLSIEIATIISFLQKYSKVCLDVEQSYWAGPDSPSWASQIAQAVTPIPGKLWLSCPANPQSNNQLPAIQALSPAVNIYMPMVYDDYLQTQWEQAFNVQSECIQPTIDLSQEFGANTIASIIASMKSAGVLALSCWELSFATASPTLLDSVVSEFVGASNVVKTNVQGMVLDIVQSYQLENGESQDLCGPWSVSSLRVAGLPGQGTRGSAEDVDTWADNEANKYMPNGQVGWPGTSIQQMYQFITDALDPVGKQRNLHWWDIPPTVANIQTAVKAGYPVLVTANEQNIQEKKTGKRPPYPWNLNANHIIPICGLDAQGDFIVADELNNNFQGYWPVVYVASVLQPSWATIVQVVGPDPANPWLAPIPSGDPSTWPQGFNAQLFAQQQQKEISTLEQAIWGLTSFLPAFNGQPPDYNSGIAHQWQKDFAAGHMHGPPISVEMQYPQVGGTANVPTQVFLSGFYQWVNGVAIWHPFS